MSTNKHLYNIAHRGARSIAPENTMLAFQKAFQVGAHGVETDVSVTSDGQLVLFHDSLLSRTTNIAKKLPKRQFDQIHTFTLQEIQALDAGSSFVEDDPFGTIKDGEVSLEEQKSMRNLSPPLLEELLLFVVEKSWFVNIEIKPLPQENSSFPVVEKLVSLLENMKLEPDVFSISSFHHPYLNQVKNLRPDIEVNALIGFHEHLQQDWGEYEFEIYNARASLTDTTQIERAHRHGCRVNLYGVDDVKEMTHFLKNGVEKIITDYPQLLAQVNL